MARKQQKRGDVQKAKQKLVPTKVDRKQVSQLRKALRSASKAAHKSGKQLDKAMDSLARYEKTGNHARVKGQLDKAISEYNKLKDPVEILSGLLGGLGE